tara:strand:- start:143 stop:310 length:168 start_codon:yes stop_codon:yes gene_type:complete
MKKWGIKVNGVWLTDNKNKVAVYDMRRKAQKDADDFNSLRPKTQNPYSVREYRGK